MKFIIEHPHVWHFNSRVKDFGGREFTCNYTGKSARFGYEVETKKDHEETGMKRYVTREALILGGFLIELNGRRLSRSEKEAYIDENKDQWIREGKIRATIHMLLRLKEEMSGFSGILESVIRRVKDDKPVSPKQMLVLARHSEEMKIPLPNEILRMDLRSQKNKEQLAEMSGHERALIEPFIA